MLKSIVNYLNFTYLCKMFINRRITCAFLGLAMLFLAGGCKTRFDKLRESNNIAQKYQEAVKYYDNKKYSKALILFDDLTNRYRGQAEAEDLYFYLANTNYKLRDYTSARYAFNEFVRMYSFSPRAEEARYMAAYCYYLEAPRSSLDQEYTYRAIESLQLFINLYPESARADEASTLIQELRDRLEHKAFANAKLYLDMGLMDDYRAAVIAFDNALRDYPDTKYAEEMEYLSIKAQYLYAYNSTIRRQEERYAEVIDLYDRFVTSYPDSKFKKEADDYRKNAERGMKEAKQKMDSFTLPEVLAAASDSVKQEIKNSQNKN